MKYTEILKLKEMLEEAHIPFTFTDDFFNVKEKNRHRCTYRQSLLLPSIPGVSNTTWRPCGCDRALLLDRLLGR